MRRTWAWTPLLLLLFAAIRLALSGERGVDAAPTSPSATPAPAVYLARGLSEESLAVLSATLAGREPTAVLLLDTPLAEPANKAFLAALKPSRIVPVGDCLEEMDLRPQRFGQKIEAPLEWSGRPTRAFWRDFHPQAEIVVVSSTRSRPVLLQAACLAGTLRAPFYLLDESDTEGKELQGLLELWQPRRVFLAGADVKLPFPIGKWETTTLRTEAAVAQEYCRRLAEKETIRTLVVANPYDVAKERPALSGLSPWTALQRKAALVLTNRAGGNVEAVVEVAVELPELRKVENVLLLADLDAIPVEKRPNPIKGDKDTEIELEPLTPHDNSPYSYCVGRLFHEDPGVAALLLERRHLLQRKTGPRRVLLASNAENCLPLLETISRHTARELINSGYETTALYGNQVSAEGLRDHMRNHDIFLWEGHHNKLIKDWNFPEWDEPLPPSLVFLQSCLALREWKVDKLFRRGAAGVIGATSRTYSASGGATSLAFFDAMIHDDRAIGDSLRNAKNFLQTYGQLKEKRFGAEAKKLGAPVRAAWSFALWGDPTLKFKRPESEPAIPPIRHTVKSNVITVHFPERKLSAVHSEKYCAECYANARLAGLVGKEKGDEGKELQTMVFVEVALPKAPEGKTPRLSSKLPSRSWVFNWDARRRVGYLLAVPREKDREELRFVVQYEDAPTARR